MAFLDSINALCRLKYLYFTDVLLGTIIGEPGFGYICVVLLLLLHTLNTSVLVALELQCLVEAPLAESV